MFPNAPVPDTNHLSALCRRLPRQLLILATFICLVAGSDAVFAQDQSVDDLLAKVEEHRQQHQETIESLIKECDKLSFDKVRAVARLFLVPRPSDRQTLYPLDGIQLEWPALDAEQMKLAERIQLANRERAAGIYPVAKQLAKAGKEAVAYQLLHEVLVHDPQHEDARRILGFKQNARKEWVRPTRKITARKASTKHSLLGWAARQYTIVDSGHYRIATTASSESGIQLAEKLEKWHNLWRQLYFEYWSKEGTISRWFDGKGNERTSSRKLKVVFFENRTEYVETLTRLGVQGVEVSSGYYNEQRKTMFFYDGDRDSDGAIRATWLQEQAHQLFQETGVTRKDAIDDENIWAVEAVAMYFESMTEFDSYATFGGMESQRLQYARIRVNRQGFFMPLVELLALGRKSFQSNDNIRSLYSQSAGLAHYFMGAEKGKYRDGFIQYIRLVYQKRTRPDTLASLTGIPLETHEKNYRAFLVPNPKNLVSMTRLDSRKELAFGGSPVNNQDIELIAKATHLNWLQLSGTRVDDGCGETVAELEKLTQLFVDGTSVGDRFLKSISHLSLLEELDLAGTNVTDAGLAEVAKMKKLKALYLTGTKITDAGLESLAGLSELEYLEVSKTGVTAAGLKDLKSKLPKLK